MFSQIPKEPVFTPTASKEKLNRRISQIEPVLYLSDVAYLNIDTINTWLEVFTAVHIAAPSAFPSGLPAEVHWHCYDPGDYRSNVWNRMLKQVDSSCVLFLEDDEMIHLPCLPSNEEPDQSSWRPALIQWQDGNTLRQCYQVRLVANNGEAVFSGRNFPDCTAYITANNIELNKHPVFIFRNKSPYDDLVPEDELSVAKHSPQIYLMMGAHYFEEGKYVHASAQYRKLLKSDDILPYDRLAAVNGLASTMAEQYKWSQAVGMAVKSIKMQPRQRLPYLILFRIHQLGKRWKEAHDILKSYYALKDELSAANFDKVLSEEETLVQLADMAFRCGLREESFDYNKKLYTLQGGNVEPELLQRLLLFAVEQSDYNKAVKFFNELFAGRIPDKMDEEIEKQVFEFLALFMKKGWYVFAAGKYQELLEYQPTNETYMRRWLVALSKSKDINKAQKVVAKMRIKKKTG